MTTRLPAAEVARWLRSISSRWTIKEVGGAPERLQREFKFKDFPSAWGFMSRVAVVAERSDHHPNWSNVYDTVKVELWTHKENGLTQKDFDLARAMDEAAAAADCN